MGIIITICFGDYGFEHWLVIY